MYTVLHLIEAAEIHIRKSEEYAGDLAATRRQAAMICLEHARLVAVEAEANPGRAFVWDAEEERVVPA